MVFAAFLFCINIILDEIFEFIHVGKLTFQYTPKGFEGLSCSSAPNSSNPFFLRILLCALGQMKNSNSGLTQWFSIGVSKQSGVLGACNSKRRWSAETPPHGTVQSAKFPKLDLPQHKNEDVDVFTPRAGPCNYKNRAPWLNFCAHCKSGARSGVNLRRGGLDFVLVFTCADI